MIDGMPTLVEHHETEYDFALVYDGAAPINAGDSVPSGVTDGKSDSAEH